MATNYGLDAPRVVHGLAIFGSVCALGAAVARLIGLGQPILSEVLLPSALTPLLTAAWMIWSSRVGKIRMAAKLLSLYAWRGDEVVLDIGCGRGLAMIEAAKRAASGYVVGIDRWQSRDLSDNSPDAARANARATGVETRISLVTGDATQLPFATKAFDVVVTTVTLHNIETRPKRSQAINEALRVLCPGGTLLIFDIIHGPSYARAATAVGAQDVRLSAPSMLWALPGWSIVIKKAPSERT
jgi:arsenite methyltransferase